MTFDPNQIRKSEQHVPISPDSYRKTLLQLLFNCPERSINDLSKILGVSVDKIKEECFRD